MNNNFIINNNVIVHLIDVHPLKSRGEIECPITCRFPKVDQINMELQLKSVIKAKSHQRAPVH